MGQSSRAERKLHGQEKQLVGRSRKATRGEEGKEERRSRASPRAESRELESNPCPNFDFRYDVPLLRVDVLILHLCSTFTMHGL